MKKIFLIFLGIALAIFLFGAIGVFFKMKSDDRAVDSITIEKIVDSGDTSSNPNKTGSSELSSSQVIVYESEPVINSKGAEVFYGSDWVAGLSESAKALIYGNSRYGVEKLDPRDKKVVPEIVFDMLSYFNYESEEIANGKVKSYKDIVKDYLNIYKNGYMKDFTFSVPLTEKQIKEGTDRFAPIASSMYTMYDSKDNYKTYCALDGRYIGIKGERPGLYNYYLYFGSCEDFLVDFVKSHPSDYKKISQ